MKKLRLTTVIVLMLVSLCTLAQRPKEIRSSDISASNIQSFTMSVTSHLSTEFDQFLTQCYAQKQAGKYIQINIPRGTYNITQIANSAIFNINNYENVIVNGNGSTMIANSNYRVFDVRESRNIIIKNFVYDMDPLPWAQGNIKGVGDGWVDVRMDQGYPSILDDQRFMPPTNSKLWIFIKDPSVKGMMKRGCKNVYVINRSRLWTRSPANRNWARVYVQDMTNIAVGDAWVMPLSIGGNFVRVTNSYMTTIEDVTAYACTASFLNSTNSSMTNFIRVKSLIKPGTNRLQANTRDIGIISQNRIGPMWDGCVFEANGDDGLNLNTSAMPLREHNTTLKTIKLVSEKNRFDAWTKFRPQIGDSLAVMKMSTRQELHVLTIKSFTTSTTRTSEGDAPTYTITYNETIPQINVNQLTKVWDISTSNPNFVVKNSTFRYIRRHGLFFFARSGVIENNLFERNTYRGIEAIEQDRLGYLPQHVVIRNNTFRDNNVHNTSSNAKLSAQVYFDLNSDGGNRTGRPIKNIKFTGNKFYSDQPGSHIYLANITNSSVKGNYFHSYKTGNLNLQQNSVKKANASLTISGNTYSKLSTPNRKLIEYASARSSQSGTKNNIAGNHDYPKMDIDGSGMHVRFPTQFHVPDSISAQIFGSKARRIEMSVSFGRNTRRRTIELMKAGNTSSGQWFYWYISTDNRIICNTGGRLIKTRRLSANWSNSNKFEFIYTGSTVKVKLNGRTISWQYGNSTVSLNTPVTDIHFLTNSSRAGGATATIKIYNYEEVSSRSALIENLKEDNGASVYPNPFKSTITVKNNEGDTNEIVKTTIVNTMGQIVFQVNQKIATSKTFNLQHLKNGIYILNVYHEDGDIKSYKIAKQ